jgi:hypothetical protein
VQRLASTRLPLAAVDEEQIGPAILVRVEKRDARPQRLWEHLLSGAAAVVHELDASGRRRVGELDGSRGRGGEHGGQNDGDHECDGPFHGYLTVCGGGWPPGE